MPQLPQRNELLLLEPLKDAGEVSPVRAAGLAAKSKELLRVHMKRLESTEAELATNLGRHRDEREASLPVGEMTSAGARRLAKQLLERDISKFSSNARRAAVAKTEVDRTEQLKKLGALEAQAKSLVRLYNSAPTVLSRHGLGSSERDKFANQLRGAGATELLDAAQFAISTGNRTLAAVVLQLNGRLEKSDRRFAGPKLADIMVGEEVQEVRRNLDAVVGAVSDALARDRSFRLGQPLSAIHRIKSGLTSRALNPETDTHEKIGRALRGKGELK